MDYNGFSLMFCNQSILFTLVLTMKKVMMLLKEWLIKFPLLIISILCEEELIRHASRMQSRSIVYFMNKRIQEAFHHVYA